MRTRISVAVAGLLALVAMLIPVVAVAEVSVDDEVVAWGNATQPGNPNVPPAGLTDVVVIAAGGFHNLALQADGTVVAWGINVEGQTDVPVGLTDVVAVSGGYRHSLALQADGTVVAWGMDFHGQATVPAGLTDVVAISGGRHHSLALQADGTVVAWGGNAFGQTDVPVGLTDVVAIDAGKFHSLALRADGTVVAWGTMPFDVPAGLTDVVAISANDPDPHGNQLDLALRADGTVVAWGVNVYGQTDVPAGLTDVVAIDAGGNHSLALQADGTVVAWGRNTDAGGITVVGQATVPAGLADVVAVSGGTFHSLALREPNEPPVSDSNGPYLGAVNTEIGFDGTASSDPDGDVLVYDWEWGDNTSSADAGSTPTHAYGAAGIYDVCLTVTDPAGAFHTACTFAVVYDPVGSVTGGGWIDSPEGAYVPDPTLTRRATFGFVAQYKKGANVPTGNTSFRFHTGDLRFHSTSYDWLVVTGNDTAKFKGVGTINGEGAYTFQIWASDSDPDTFRIKIWTEDEAGVETVVYDNQMQQPIGGGNIVVHKK